MLSLTVNFVKLFIWHNWSLAWLGPVLGHLVRLGQVRLRLVPLFLHTVLYSAYSLKIGYKLRVVCAIRVKHNLVDEI